MGEVGVAATVSDEANEHLHVLSIFLYSVSGFAKSEIQKECYYM